MLVNTLAKRKFLVCVIVITMITLVYLPYMARQRRDDPEIRHSVRAIRSRYLPFRRKLPGPIHAPKVLSSSHKTSKVHGLYQDALRRLLRDSKTFRDYLQKSYNVFPWPMRRMERLKRKNRYIIFRCDTQYRCGGLANRIQGVVTSFLLASLTNRTLKVEILDSPCPFTKFLRSNVANWSLPLSFHKKLDQNVSGIRIISSTPDLSFFKSSNSKLDVAQIIPNKFKYIYVTSNRKVIDKLREHIVHHQLLDWMKDLNKTEIYSALLRFLFKPSSHLSRQVKQIGDKSSPSHNHKLACVFNSTRSHDISTNILSFVKLYSRKSDYKLFINPEFLRDNIMQRTGIPHHKFISHLANPLVNLTATLKDAKGGKVCTHLEEIYSYAMHMHCDALLVNTSPVVHLIGLARGGSDGAVCTTKDGKSISKTTCL